MHNSLVARRCCYIQTLLHRTAWGMSQPPVFYKDIRAFQLVDCMGACKSSKPYSQTSTLCFMPTSMPCVLLLLTPAAELQAVQW